MISSPWFVPVLIAVVLPFVIRGIAAWLNWRALAPSPPAELADVYEPAAYARSQAYTRELTRLDMLESAFELAALLGFWFGGGFEWLAALIRSLNAGEVISGLVGFAVVFAAAQLVALPFSIYDTFVLERRYGFNRTSLKTFVADRLKGLALMAILGLPVATLVLWLFSRTPQAWLWSWMVAAIVSVTLAFLAPRWLFPLFNKFTPLPDGELKSAIHRLAIECQFPVGEISVIDGSRRTTKANAFFTGFGRNKRIALYDTLIANHGVAEIVGVLAHEIGHFKRGHIWQMLAFGLLKSGILFFLLGWGIGDPRLYQAFGVTTPSVWIGFVLFGMVSSSLVLVMGIALAALSRNNEFEADEFAARVTGNPRPLIDGLKRLSRDHLANLTPHPFFVWLHHGHPPLRERLAALAAHGWQVTANRLP